MSYLYLVNLGLRSKIVLHQRAATAARLLTEALHLSASAGEDEAREKDGSDLGTEAANTISLRAAKNEMECCRIDDDHDDEAHNRPTGADPVADTVLRVQIHGHFDDQRKGSLFVLSGSSSHRDGGRTLHSSGRPRGVPIGGS